MAGYDDESLENAIRRVATMRGIDPVDLGTVISYETGGTFDPWKKGPTTKWGSHEGFIQMGEPQRQQYGYKKGMGTGALMDSVGRYLDDRGVKPGMGLLDIYSTINAGAPGLYNRSDAGAGGAPGTVRDKVENQMFGHIDKSKRLLGMLQQTGAPGLTLNSAPTGAESGLAAYPPPVNVQTPQVAAVGVEPNTAPASPVATASAQGIGDLLKSGDLLGAGKAIGGNDKIMGALGGIAKGLGGTETEAPKMDIPQISTNSESIAGTAPSMMAEILNRRRARAQSMGLSLGGMPMMGGM